MKPRVLLSIAVLLSLVLAALPAPMAAEAPQAPSMKVLDVPMQLSGAENPAPETAVAASSPVAPESAWTIAPASPFALTRFDGVFVSGPEGETWANKIYFMGGRSGGSTEDPNIWQFDPVTGNYADTGTDMVEDVSNYFANLIEDDGTGRGPAVYLVGGYNADAATPNNIGTVQRYYPQVNVVEALPMADDWTVLVAGNLVGAMGQAVVDDKIYVFGGWENLAAPYFYAGTWVFDPSQPSGSRWTNLGLDLNPARSYIQVAQQNGKIYAMGGIYQYTAGDLVPTVVVQVLDTANLAAGWTTVSPMPVKSAEGRGYGFDADTLAPMPWDGHVYMAGGGDWNGRSAESMEYLTASDTWIQSFPDLNQARRDHAGAFVPLCTPDPDDGLPGLWVFGGNIAADEPPFGDPEFYPLPCAGEASVQLMPAYQQGNGDPGTTVTYDLTLTNLLGYEETFDLVYSSVWPISGPATVGPVPNNGQADFQVQVTIPADAECNAQDLATVTAWDSTNTYSDTAEILTIAAGDWQPESNAGASAAHWMAFACTDDYGTGGTCFYAGGLGVGNTVTGAARKYDIATGAWSTIASLLTPVFGAVGGYLGGKFCVAGGFTTTTGDWGGTYATQCYNPGSNSWAPAADIPGPVEIGGAGGAAGGGTGGLLAGPGGCGTNACASNQHFAFDGAHWEARAVLPDYLVFHGAATGEGKLFVGGEYSGSSGFYEYQSGTNSWVNRASLPGGAGKKSPVGAVVPGGGAFWWGGDLGDWSGVQDTTWYYEPNSDGWVQFAATLNQATTGAGGGMAGGVLWSFGGSTGAGPISPPPHESLEDWCVPPPPDAGALEGVVYDANTGLPIENARVWVEGVTDPGYYADRLTNTAGEYSFAPILAGDYTISASAYGYDNVLFVPVTIVADATTIQDFGMEAPAPDLQPKAVSANVPPDSSKIFNMTLDNNGSADLLFHVTELEGGAVLSPNKADVPMPSGVDPQVYADLQAAADGTGRFVVYLKEQADLSAAFDIEDWSARGQYVLDTLRATAERSQAGLRAALESAGAEYESRYIVNAVAVTGNAALVDGLSALLEVGYIGPDAAVPAPEPVDSSPADSSPDAIEWNIAMIMADSVWSDFGVTGQGMVISNIDTGVQYDHPALVQQYRGNLGGSYDHNYNWWDPYNQNPLVPTDGSAVSHGTHTMGTMVGSDNPADPSNAPNAIGVAPGAEWMACDGFDNSTGYGYTVELLECAEFILAPWDLNGQNPDPLMRPDVVNNSWGGGQAQWWYNQAVYAWRAAGIWPSFSNGNDGPSCGTAGDPGDMDNVISAGATNSADTITGFSSRGPAAVTGIIKPDVSAPGENIRSSVKNNSYSSLGGTSMASPHVAATAGLIWSAVPALRGNVQITEWIMEQTADVKLDSQCGPAGPPNNVYGWGRVNAYNAVGYALSNAWDVPWLTVDPASGTVDPYAVHPIALTFDSTGLTVGECYYAQLKVEYNDAFVVEEYIPLEMCVVEGYRIYHPIVMRSY